MARFNSPCRLCGEPTKQTVCEECTPVADRQRVKPTQKKLSSTARGYGSRWQRLSKLVRAMQPFCTDCGTEEDLQADHSPETWARIDKGLPLRPTDVEVVCGRCNRARGAARGERVKR